MRQNNLTKSESRKFELYISNFKLLRKIEKKFEKVLKYILQRQAQKLKKKCVKET